MITPPQRHLLFLSHAGVDRAAAEALARRIEAAPSAKAHGLAVWVDTRGSNEATGLRLGENWHQQLEQAIADSTAFAVYVPPAGASFWVDIEMRLAIERVAAGSGSGQAYPFIPIVGEGRDLKSLPPTARLFQASLRSLDDGLEPIIRAVLKLDDSERVKLVDEPFMGLGAFDAEKAALFFGREQETQDLVEQLRATNFVVVVSDSGAGKSSLVKAGLVPRFREGVFADGSKPGRPDPADWHVVEMRPGRDPFEGLVDGVSLAARASGVSFDSTTHGEWIRSRRPGQIRDALREAAPPNARLLLVVDQFEELWTLTPDSLRAAFLAGLLELAPRGDFCRRVVATMRRDYFNLCGESPGLKERLGPPSGGGRFLLRRMSAEGLRVAITKPLALAGERAIDAEELADAVLRDVTDQPGNLALLEMALTEAWRQRRRYDGNLIRAYEQIGRVEGALATAAEDTFANPSNDPQMLNEAERPIAEQLFMRLVRVGDAQGATRRVVRQEELTAEGWRVAQELATKECRRLLVVRERAAGEEQGAGSVGDSSSGASATAELSHEQLVTQWGRYQHWLRSSPEDPTRAEDKQQLDRLMDRAERWVARGRQREDLAAGSDLAEFGALATSRDAWLSGTEREFIRESAKRRRQRRVTAFASLAAVVAVLAGAATVSTVFWRKAEARAVAAEATLLWHPLEFQGGDVRDEEIAALWKLGEAPPATRAAFVEQMLESEALAERFSRAPEAITHALLRVDRRRRQEVLDRVAREDTESTRPRKVRLALGLLVLELEESSLAEHVLAAIAETSDPDQISDLVSGLAALSPNLSPEQWLGAVDTVVAGTCDGRATSEQLDALGDGLAALTRSLRPDLTEAVVERVLAWFERTAEPEPAGALLSGLAPIATRMSPEDVGRAIEHSLAIIGHSDPYKLAMLEKGLTAMASRLSQENMEGAADQLLTAITPELSENRLQTLMAGLAVMSPTFSPDCAREAVGHVLAAIGEVDDSEELAALLFGLDVLVAGLGPEHSTRAVEQVLAAIRGTADPDRLAAIMDGLDVLSRTRSSDRAKGGLQPVLEAIGDTSRDGWIVSRSPEPAALPARLTAEHARAKVTQTLTLIQDHLRTGSNSAFFDDPWGTLPASLSPTQADDALEQVLAAMSRSTSPDELWALVQGVAALSPLGSQTPELAEALLRALANPHIAVRLSWPKVDDSGEARDVLSTSLRARVEDAPDENDGWWALIAWAEQRFPDFDFTGERQPRSGSR